MFFLYQRGFIKGIDNEEDIEYRSKNGADDVTPLARTLWEYVICNMNTEILGKGSDKNKGLYPIVYARRGRNYELKSGYINMLKLMWNIASALNLKSDALGLAKSKINALSELEKYDETAFKEALHSTFYLFCTKGGIEFTLPFCNYEKINENNEVIGAITVIRTKGEQKLDFTIKHETNHAQVKHNPIKFNFFEYLRKCKGLNALTRIKLSLLELKGYEHLDEKDKRVQKGVIEELNKNLKSSIAMLLIRNFINSSFKQIASPGGFYEAFAGEKLYSNDAFRNTDLYKKYKALSAFKILQGEENNVDIIYKVIDVETMRGAKEITAIKNASGKQQATKGKLSDIIYERYLKKYENEGGHFPYINSIICFYKFGEIEGF